MDLNYIKLIIWDLDDTFWNGSLSLNTATIPNNRKELILNLINCGIMQSISSKNEFDHVKEFLKFHELWYYFIFPMINYNLKSDNIRQIITNVKVLPKNILFIDDNPFNLNDVKFHFPDIQVYSENIIDELLLQIGKLKQKDRKHTKLNNYKLLETKHSAEQNFSSNDQFLMQSDIVVSIHKDCKYVLDRILDLENKSNQLNYSKRRINYAALESIINNTQYDKGYVSVTDRYGNYGIVGFYSIKDNMLLDFFFSCRVLGMGVEQAVFAYLGYPQINIVTPVAKELTKLPIPKWITINNDKKIDFKSVYTASDYPQILFRGECDIRQIEHYLGYKDNVSIETDLKFDPQDMYNNYNLHTTLLVQKITLEKSIIKQIISNTFFYNNGTFVSLLHDNNFDLVVMSLSADIRQGLYKNNVSNDIIVAGDFLHPISDNKSIEEISKLSRIVFDDQKLKWFNENYKYLGPISPQQLQDNLEVIIAYLQTDTNFVFFRGVELNIGKNGDKLSKRNKEINIIIDTLHNKYPDKIFIIDLNKFIKSVLDIEKDILHFNRIVYYQISFELSRLLYKKFDLNATITNYKLPFLSNDRSIYMYKLFGRKEIILLGVCRESILMARNLKSHASYIVDLNADNSYEIDNLNFKSFSSFAKKYSKSYHLIIPFIFKEDINITNFININKLVEYDDFDIMCNIDKKNQ